MGGWKDSYCRKEGQLGRKDSWDEWTGRKLGMRRVDRIKKRKVEQRGGTLGKRRDNDKVTGGMGTKVSVEKRLGRIDEWEGIVECKNALQYCT